jgi:hypothetical protein
MFRASFYISLFCLLTSSLTAWSQETSPGKGPYRLPYIVEGSDTIPVINLPDVMIVDATSPEYLKNLQAYYRLRYNVIKVYPYARLAAIKVDEMNRQMAGMKNDRERRRYRKQVEDQVREDFEQTVKKLSINQGKVLIKLIDRETGRTSYDLIKSLKGSFNAFFAQGLAKMFGHDLKSEYDPEGEDKTIENIVRQIEAGQITF